MSWEQITQDPKFNRQNSCTFGLIHQGVVGGEGQESAECPWAPCPSPNLAMLPLQVPLDPLVFVGGAEGNACEKL